MIGAFVYRDGPAAEFAMRVPEASPDLALIYDDPDTRVQIWENHTAFPRVFLAPTHGSRRRGETRRTVWRRRRTCREKSGSRADRIWCRHRPEGGSRASGWGSN